MSKKMLGLVALVLLAAGCGASDSGDISGVGPVGGATVIEDRVEVIPSVENTLGFLRESGGLAWANIEAINGTGDEYAMTFAVSEMLWAADGNDDIAASYSTGPFEEPEYERITTVDFAVGDRVLVWIFDGEVLSVAKPASSGGFVDSGTRHPFHMLSQGYHAGFADHVMSPPELPCSPDESAESATYVEAMVRYLDESSPRQNWQLHQEDVARIGRTADNIAADTPEFVDPVLGETVPHNGYDLIQQLLDGIDRADVVVRPTVPTYWDVSGLEDHVELVITSGDVMLALVSLTPGMPSGFDSAPSIAESFLGAPRDPSLPMKVWQVPSFDLTGCTIPSDYVARAESKGTLLTEIPYEDFAGAGRALIEVVDGDATWSKLSEQDINDLTNS